MYVSYRGGAAFPTDKARKRSELFKVFQQRPYRNNQSLACRLSANLFSLFYTWDAMTTNKIPNWLDTMACKWFEPNCQWIRELLQALTTSERARDLPLLTLTLCSGAAFILVFEDLLLIRDRPIVRELVFEWTPRVMAEPESASSSFSGTNFRADGKYKFHFIRVRFNLKTWKLLSFWQLWEMLSTAKNLSLKFQIYSTFFGNNMWFIFWNLENKTFNKQTS